MDKDTRKLALALLSVAESRLTRLGARAPKIGSQPIQDVVQNAWMTIYTTPQESGPLVGEILEKHILKFGYQCHAHCRLAFREGKLFLFYDMPIKAIYDPYGGGGGGTDYHDPDFQAALREGLSRVKAYLGVAPFEDMDNKYTWKANVAVTPPNRHIKGSLGWGTPHPRLNRQAGVKSSDLA